MDGNLALDDNRLLESECFHLPQHFLGFLVFDEVAHQTFPVRREEVRVNGQTWIVLFCPVHGLMCLFPVRTGVASGEDLYAIAVDFMCATHDFLSVIDFHRLSVFIVRFPFFSDESSMGLLGDCRVFDNLFLDGVLFQ